MTSDVNFKKLLQTLELIEKSDLPTCEYLHRILEDKSIRFDDDPEDEKQTHPLITEAESLATSLLITAKGQSDFVLISHLKDHGYGHKVVERDNFGPLRCMIVMRKGGLLYG